MDSNIVFVAALLLIATFAIPTLAATFEKDFISDEVVRAILEKANVNAMPYKDVISALTGKTVMPNAAVEDLLKNVDHGVNGFGCSETCLLIPCATAIFGCSCIRSVCYINSLDM